MYSLDNGEYSTYHAFSKIRIFFALTGQSTKTRIHNIRNVLSVLQFLRVIHLCGILRSVTEKKNNERQLQCLSRMDIKVQNTLHICFLATHDYKVEASPWSSVNLHC